MDIAEHRITACARFIYGKSQNSLMPSMFYWLKPDVIWVTLFLCKQSQNILLIIPESMYASVVRSESPHRQKTNNLSQTVIVIGKILAIDTLNMLTGLKCRHPYVKDNI
jgi:hypothetical protein